MAKNDERRATQGLAHDKTAAAGSLESAMASRRSLLQASLAAAGTMTLSPALFPAVAQFGASNGVPSLPFGRLLQAGDSTATAPKPGEMLWKFSTGDWVRRADPDSDGPVYIGSSGRRVFALNRENDNARWQFEGSEIFTSPTVVGDSIYVGSRDSNVYAIDAASGEERWRFAASGTVSSSPAVADGTVYIGSADGNLYAIMAELPPLQPGGTARITTETSLRGGPSASAVERETLSPDTIVTITGEAVGGSDVSWWPVTVKETDREGWVEESALQAIPSNT